MSFVSIFVLLLYAYHSGYNFASSNCPSSCCLSVFLHLMHIAQRLASPCSTGRAAAAVLSYKTSWPRAQSSPFLVSCDGHADLTNEQEWENFVVGLTVLNRRWSDGKFVTPQEHETLLCAVDSGNDWQQLCSLLLQFLVLPYEGL